MRNASNPADGGGELSRIDVMGLAARISALASCLLVWVGAAAQTVPQAPGGEPSAEPFGTAAKPFWRLALSPYTLHFSNDSHHRSVYMVGAERQRPDGYLLGAAYFRNSFGEPGAYAFVGQRIDHWHGGRLYLYWSAGVLYGYKGEYAHKVPLNVHGFSPAALGGIGWQLTRELSTQVNLLGTSGLMFQLSVDLR
ncbi:MAG: ABC transporter ATP-binding protein [Burkholderiaceae bacterium]